MIARLALAALLAGAIAGAGLVAPAATAATASGASLVVAPDGGGVVREGRGLTVSVTVTSTSAAALAAGSLAFSLESQPVASATALLQSIAAPPEVLLGQLLPDTTAAVPALAPSATTIVRARITAKDLATTLSPASGARLLYVRYRSGTVQTVAESAVVRMSGTSAGSVGFGAVVPVLAPAGDTGIVDSASQQVLADPGGGWDTAVRAAEAAPWASVALDPAVIASIRLAGVAAPTGAQDLLLRLRDLPNQVIELPYADGDVTLERAAGVTATLAPVGFAGASAAGPSNGDATAAPAPTTTAGTSGTGAEDLTAWRWSSQRVAWPVPGTTSAADAAALGRAGQTLLLSSDDIGDTAVRRAAGPFAQLGSTTTTALVSDATASSLLTAASGPGPEGDAALAQLMGVLATDAVTGDTPAVLATVGRPTETTGTARVLALLGRMTWIRGRSLADLASAAQPTRVTLAAGTVAASRVGTARALLAGEHDVRRLASAATSGATTLTAPARLALLGTLSAAWRGNDRGWTTTATAVGRGFARVRDSVTIPTESSGLNSIGTDGRLQVVVRNDLDVPVEVVVHPSVSNNRLQFSGRDVSVTVPAKGSNRALLAFRTITNGSTDVTLALSTPGGSTIGRSVVRKVNVSAGFDTIVAGALLGALALLLGLGVYRNVKRRGRPREAAA